MKICVSLNHDNSLFYAFDGFHEGKTLLTIFSDNDILTYENWKVRDKDWVKTFQTNFVTSEAMKYLKGE